MAVLAATAAIAVAAAAALGAGEPSTPLARPTPDAQRSPVGVAPYDGCGELLDDLRDLFDADGSPRAYGFGLPPGAIVEYSDQRYPARTPTIQEEAGPDVELAGADSPDMVEVDGDRMLVLHPGPIGPDGRQRGPVLRWVDTAGELPVLLGTLQLPDGSGDGMLVHEDRALVMLHTTQPLWSDGTRDGEDEAMRRGPVNRLVEVDLSHGPAGMSVTRTTDVEGHSVTARLIDGDARIVLDTWPMPDVPRNRTTWSTATEGARAQAMRSRREAIDRAPIEAWLPRARSVAGPPSPGAETQGVDRIGCESIVRPVAADGETTSAVLSRPMLTSVWTVDLDEPGRPPVPGAALFGGGETVHASATSLYYAATELSSLARRIPRRSGSPPARPLPLAVHRRSGEASGPGTSLHRFDLAAPGGLRHTATGSLVGLVGSMSEHEGRLRVLVSGLSAPGLDARSVRAAEPQLVVLGEDGERLVEIGRVPVGFAAGFVRYVGDIAFVAPHRNFGAAYVVDLRDPASPKVTSSIDRALVAPHLHRAGDGRLIAVGFTGRPPSKEGSVLLVDVRDLTDPERTAAQPLGFRRSEAEREARAFLWEPASATAFVPVEDSIPPEQPFSGAIAVRVVGSELVEVGRISHPVASAPIRRSVVVGGNVLTVSHSGVMASRLSDLAPVAWVPFR